MAALSADTVAGDLQPILVCGDAFLAKLSLDGKTLLQSTLLGGSQDAAIMSIALDPTTPNGPSAVYATGFTESPNFPGAKGPYHGPTTDPNGKGVTEGDAFVAKLAPGFGSLDYSILIGGSFDDAGLAIAVDGSGDAIVAGSTCSGDFPVTSGALQQPPPSSEPVHGFVFKLDPTGNTLLYSTSINGNTADSVFGAALDTSGNAYLTGMTDSSNFPVTAGVLQPAFGGGTDNNGPIGDAFLMKIAGLAAASTSKVTVAAVDNAASYATGSVSPGEIVSIFGSGMGGSTLVTAEVDTATGKLRVWINPPEETRPNLARTIEIGEPAASTPIASRRFASVATEPSAANLWIDCSSSASRKGAPASGANSTCCT